MVLMLQVIFQGYRGQFAQSKQTAEHLFVFLVFFGLTWASACARLASDQRSLTYYNVLDNVYGALSVSLVSRTVFVGVLQR